MNLNLLPKKSSDVTFNSAQHSINEDFTCEQALKAFLLPAVCAISFLLTSCSIYRPDVLQGNSVSVDQISNLSLGMSRQQVQQVLGTFLLQDVFNAKRMDYLYRTLKSNGDLEQRLLTVYFDSSDKVLRWQGVGLPSSAPMLENKVSRKAPDDLISANVLMAEAGVTSPLSAEVLATHKASPVIVVALADPVVDLVNTRLDGAPAIAAVRLVEPEKTLPIVPVALVKSVPVLIDSEKIAVKNAVKTSAITSVESTIKASLHAWKQAWESKDIQQYANAYENAYSLGATSHTAWLDMRQRMFDASGDIKINLSNLKWIQTSETEARVTFTQHYQSKILLETGLKQLYLQRDSANANQWKIVTERFLKPNKH
jgi:outer membrane protein assembly factor BamE